MSNHQLITMEVLRLSNIRVIWVMDRTADHLVEPTQDIRQEEDIMELDIVGLVEDTQAMEDIQAEDRSIMLGMGR